MRAARIHTYGGPDRLVLEEVPKPEPAAGELLVSVKAASVNPVDFKTRDGGVKVLLKYRLPITLGCDLAGVVTAIGAGVTRFQIGEPIFARLDKLHIGAFADFAIVREADAARKPEALDFVQSASIPLVGLTAWQALIEIGGLSSGQDVLIHAGSGGVGTFAIQLAKHLGAHVTTTCSAKNAALCTSLGAARVIDYKTEQFDEGNSRYDVILDTQGGETLERCFRVVKKGGVVVTIGGVPDAKFGKAWGLNPFLVLALRFMTRKVTRLAKQSGAKFEYLFMRPDGAQLAQIGALLEAGTIKPVIDRTFELANIKEAMAYVESGRAVGKVVVTP